MIYFLLDDLLQLISLIFHTSCHVGFFHEIYEALAVRSYQLVEVEIDVMLLVVDENPPVILRFVRQQETDLEDLNVRKY